MGEKSPLDMLMESSCRGGSGESRYSRFDADVSTTMSCMFGETDRFFNVGIAEANMEASWQAGDLRFQPPVTLSRCSWQAGLRPDKEPIAYPGLNAKIVGPMRAPPLEDGATHQCRRTWP